MAAAAAASKRLPEPDGAPDDGGTPDKRSRTEQKKKNGRVVAVYYPKGGTGKTTVALGLQAALERERPETKVVLVDLDPVANLTLQLLRAEDIVAYDQRVAALQAKLTSVELIAMPQHFVSVWRDITTEKDVIDEEALRIPTVQGTLSLLQGGGAINEVALGIERQMGGGGANTAAFGRVIQELREKFDVVILDLNASVSNLNLAALDVADELIAPLLQDPECLYSLRTLNAALHQRAIQSERDQNNIPPQRNSIPPLTVRLVINQSSFAKDKDNHDYRCFNTDFQHVLLHTPYVGLQRENVPLSLTTRIPARDPSHVKRFKQPFIPTDEERAAYDELAKKVLDSLLSPDPNPLKVFCKEEKL